MINSSSLAGGKGKGKGKGKSQKGKFGGKMSFMTNPKGSDGNVMKCHECGSENHLIASCPKKKGGKGKGKGGKRFYGDTSQPSQFNFQPGAFSGIVNGQRDNWFIGNTTAVVEEIEEDDGWWTDQSGRTPASGSGGTGMFAVTDKKEEPKPQSSSGIRGQTLMFPSWEIVSMKEQPDGETYLVRTRMATAPGVGLLIDPGSPENLCGDAWSNEMQQAAIAAGRPPVEYKDLPRALEVGGIGVGTQSAHQSGLHAIGLPDGTDAAYEAPILPKSGTPALLGQRSLKRMRCLLDCFNGQLYRIGPGGYQLHLSPGSVKYPLEESHAGHLMLPCSRFQQHPEKQQKVQVFAAAEEPKTTPTTPRFSREAWRGTSNL